ncbi:MAG: hypothetical protein ACLUYV_03890 [Alistipes shahii]
MRRNFWRSGGHRSGNHHAERSYPNLSGDRAMRRGSGGSRGTSPELTERVAIQSHGEGCDANFGRQGWSPPGKPRSCGYPERRRGRRAMRTGGRRTPPKTAWSATGIQ